MESGGGRWRKRRRKAKDLGTFFWFWFSRVATLSALWIGQRSRTREAEQGKGEAQTVALGSSLSSELRLVGERYRRGCQVPRFLPLRLSLPRLSLRQASSLGLGDRRVIRPVVQTSWAADLNF